MPQKLRARLTFANVVSVIALFVALGGAGYAAVHLKKNSVKSKQIKDGAVRNGDLADASVTAAKVADGSLTAADIDQASLDLGVGRSTVNSEECSDNEHNGVVCVSQALNLPRDGRALVSASTIALTTTFDDPSGAGSGADVPNLTSSACFARVDGTNLEGGRMVFTQSTGADALGGESTAVTIVTDPLPAGEHNFDLRCQETDGEMLFANSTVTAVSLDEG